MKKILTVVVPTYNAEKYLRNNLESFCIAEVLSDIEVLVINDGSTDKSLEVAKEYAEKYPNTYRVISKENGGHGSGINCGIQNAVGKYFKVVDADDWVDRKAFCNLISYLKTSSLDMICSGFLWAYDRGEESGDKFKKKAEMKKPFKEVIYEKEYFFDEIAELIYIKMHNITVKTSILRDNKILIDENCFYVDSEYISYPIPYIKTIGFIKDFVYMYRVGIVGQSVSIEKMQQNECHYEKVIRSLLEFYLKLGIEIPCSLPKRKYLAQIIARVVASRYKIMLSVPANSEKKNQIKEYDQNIRNKYSDVYRANKSLGVFLLRKSGYRFYWIASALVKRIYK